MFNRLSFFIFSLLPAACFASQTATNSWEKVLKSIADSLTGPVAYFIGILAVCCCGMVVIFGDMQNGGQRFVLAGCGIAIIGAASAIITHFFGFNGALI